MAQPLLDSFLFPALEDPDAEPRGPRLPYDRHLRWLAIEGYSEVSIKQFYDRLQIPKPSRKALDEAASSQEQIKPPSSLLKRLQKKIYQPEDSAYWDKLGFSEVYLQRMVKASDTLKELWTEVGQLLQDPVLRVTVDCLRLAGLTHVELTEIMTENGSKLMPSIPALELYERYLFDFGAMRLGDWQSYLVSLQDDPYSYARYHAALTQGVDAVLQLCNLPTRRQYTDYLRSILALAEMKVRHHARLNVPGSEAEARKWSKTGMDAGDRFQKFSGKSQGDLLKFIQTEFEYVPSQIEAASEEIIRAAMPAPTQEGQGVLKLPAQAITAPPRAAEPDPQMELAGEPANAPEPVPPPPPPAPPADLTGDPLSFGVSGGLGQDPGNGNIGL